MKQKKPKHCKGCRYYCIAGHKEGTSLANSKSNNWCTFYATAAPRAEGACRRDNGKVLK